MIEGSTILLTGGTGSFGQVFTRIVLDTCKPNQYAYSLVGKPCN